MVQLISDNNFLMNRLTHLVSTKKAMMENHSVTGVLVTYAELEILKPKVLQYV